MTTQWHLMDGKISRLLDRPELHFPISRFDAVVPERILITGSAGFIGRRLCETAMELGAEICPFDLPRDVRNISEVAAVFKQFRPTVVLHLAAHKYATSAEALPATVADLNIRGTENVVEMAAAHEAILVLASTCKAADPCTVYGASKLIAERVALNYDYSKVVRLVNVLGSTGSVIDLWNRIPRECPLPIASAFRYCISPKEAVGILLAAIYLDRGIYIPRVRQPTKLRKLARLYDSTRDVTSMPLRRGDRYKEQLRGQWETIVETEHPSIRKIKEPWTRH